MRNLLMISYPFPPNASAGAVRSERFVRYLRKHGWNVNVVTIKPRKDISFKRWQFEESEKKNIVFRTKTIDPWLWAMQKDPKGFFWPIIRRAIISLFSFPDHMLLWVPFAIKKSLEILKKERIDAIYTTSPPHSTHLAGLVLTQIAKIPWVCDFRDPWTLNAYHSKEGAQKLLLKIEGIIEKAVLKKAKLILSNTSANKKNLIKAFPDIVRSKVIHVPNGWESFPDNYDRISENGPLSIIHTGTFYPKFKPYGLFHAIAAWRKGEISVNAPAPGPDRLKIVLLGARDSITAKTIKKLGLNDIVKIESRVPLEDARKKMCRSDLLLATLGTGKESSTYIPSKLFEYLSAGKPIIGFFPQGEAQKLIEKTGTGFVFTSDNSKLVVNYLNNMIELKLSKKNVFEYFPVQKYLNRYHIEHIVKRFVYHLDKML